MPARIVCGDDGLWMAIIDGEAREAAIDPLHAQGVDRIWHSGVEIKQSEYDYLNALREAAKRWQPHHPACDPTKPINPNLLSPIEP